jgi:hypothetical protein
MKTTINAMPSLMERARIALTFYREDMQRQWEKDNPGCKRDYPYGIDVENAVRECLGEPLIPAPLAPMFREAVQS